MFFLWTLNNLANDLSHLSHCLFLPIILYELTYSLRTRCSVLFYPSVVVNMTLFMIMVDFFISCYKSLYDCNIEWIFSW